MTSQESFANFMTVQYFHDTRGHDWYCYKLGLERTNYHKEADTAYVGPSYFRPLECLSSCHPIMLSFDVIRGWATSCFTGW